MANSNNNNNKPDPVVDPALDNGPPIMGPVVNLKLPQFWSNDPQIWFAQIEAQFETRRINSQQSRFAHVISALQPEVAQEVRDVLLNPPQVDAYKALKEQLIRRMSESEQRRLQLLLTEEELGDRKPSQLLRKMNQLLGERKLETGILKQLFVQRLPTNVQLILSTASTALSNEQLANLADRIMDVPLFTSSVHSVHVPSPPTTASVTSSPSPIETAISSLQDEIKRLSMQVRTLQGNMRDRERSRSPAPGYRRPSVDRRKGKSSSHSFSNSDPNVGGTPSASDLCWYHLKFGSNAHKCTPPCSFEQNSGNL